MTPTPQPFNWAEYLRLATELSATQDEASHRSSISRAYYSIFHAATIKAQSNGYSGRSHQKLWALYQRDADRNCRKLSTIGNTMKVAREDADYVTIRPRYSRHHGSTDQKRQRVPRTPWCSATNLAAALGLSRSTFLSELHETPMRGAKVNTHLNTTRFGWKNRDENWLESGRRLRGWHLNGRMRTQHQSCASLAIG